MFTIHEKRLRRARKARAHKISAKLYKAPAFTWAKGAPALPKNSDNNPGIFARFGAMVAKFFAPRGMATAGRAR